MGETSIVFDHVHLISENPEATANWYADMLGGKLSGIDEVLGTTSARVVFEGAIIIIRSRKKDETPKSKEGVQWGYDHFSFCIKRNFYEFCNRLKEKGVKFTKEPYDFSPTLSVAYIEAPDGVSIELLERKT